MAQQSITAGLMRGNVLEWTTLHAGREGWKSAGTWREALAPEGETLDWTAAATAAAVRKAAARFRGEVVLAIPAEKTLLRVVSLPTTDAAELRSMAELQVDKISPFPIEHMAVACEALRAGEKSTLALVGAVQREVADALGQLLVRAGVVPHAIDVDALGWWQLLRDAGGVREAGRQVLLVADRPGLELMISQDGLPVLLRSLGLPRGLTRAEFVAEVAEEVGYTLTSLEAEWGAFEAAPVAIWHWADDPQEDLAALLRRELASEVTLPEFDPLPPLSEGIARRFAARGRQALNFAPAAWGATERQRRARRGFLVATALFLAAWLAAAAGLALFFRVQAGAVAALRARVAQIEGPAEEVRVLQEKTRSFEQFADRSHSALECLREIATLLPGGVKLTSFNYSKRNASLVLAGQADTPDQVYDFFQALGKSTLFIGVKQDPITSQTRGGVVRQEFRVMLSLPGKAEGDATDAP